MDCGFYCAETFYFDVVPPAYFCFCYLCFWCHHGIIAKNNAVKFSSYVSLGSFTVSGLLCKS